MIEPGTRAVFDTCPRRLDVSQECCGSTHLRDLAAFSSKHANDREDVDTGDTTRSHPIARFVRNRMFGALNSDPRRWLSEAIFNPELSKLLNNPTITSRTKVRLERALNGVSVTTPKLPDCPLKNLRS